jgi:hypothetical protein
MWANVDWKKIHQHFRKICTYNLGISFPKHTGTGFSETSVNLYQITLESHNHKNLQSPIFSVAERQECEQD